MSTKDKAAGELSADAARIKAIRERVDAASPAPWVRPAPIDSLWVTTGDDYQRGVAFCLSRGMCDAEQFGQDSDNADFIAAAREDVPWLLDRLEAVTRERDAACKQWPKDVEAAELRGFRRGIEAGAKQVEARARSLEALVREEVARHSTSPYRLKVADGWCSCAFCSRARPLLPESR